MEIELHKKYLVIARKNDEAIYNYKEYCHPEFISGSRGIIKGNKNTGCWYSPLFRRGRLSAGQKKFTTLLKNMKLGIDKNNILYIEGTEDTAGKEYTHTVSGYTFTSLDKEILVYHKKEIKQIRLKNLSDKMNVFCLKERGVYAPEFDQASFLKAFGIFQGYEEETNQTYYFFPKFPEKEIEEINKKLQKLDINISLQKTEKGVCLQGELTTSDEELFSFLFAIVLLYGKLDHKNNELKSIKIHIPLFGQFMKYKEFFDQTIAHLQAEGIFLSTSIQQNNDGITYQIASSDWELLETFALWYKPIENIEKISKLELTNQVKGQVEEYIKQENIENQKEALNLLDDGILKVLQK